MHCPCFGDGKGGGDKQWSNWSLDYTQLYPLSPPHSLYTPIYSLSWLLKAEAQHCFWPTPVLYIFAGMTVRFSLREYICTEFFFFFFLLPCLRVPQVYTHIHAHTHTLSLSLSCTHTHHGHTHTHTHSTWSILVHVTHSVDWSFICSIPTAT